MRDANGFAAFLSLFFSLGIDKLAKAHAYKSKLYAMQRKGLSNR